MSYRNLLVQMDETPASWFRAEIAAALAHRLNAHVTGLFMTSAFVENYLVQEAAFYLPSERFEALAKHHQAAVLRASESARMTFEKAAEAAGAQSDWLIVDGESDEALVACARRHDLTIFPRLARVSRGMSEFSAAHLGLVIGGPVLIVQDDGVDRTLGKRVLIAWNGSKEAARALRDAWPLLTEADEVAVLMVAPRGDDSADGMLQRHLERHGFMGRVIVDHGDDESVAEILRSRVADMGADLLVMGLYGRSRLSELVLGGVSRNLLGDPPTSMLVSH